MLKTGTIVKVVVPPLRRSTVQEGEIGIVASQVHGYESVYQILFEDHPPLSMSEKALEVLEEPEKDYVYARLRRKPPIYSVSEFTILKK